MTTDWRDALEKDFAELRCDARGGATFALRLVPAWALHGLMTIKDKDVRILLRAIAQWAHSIEQAQHDDYYPGCVCCGGEIHRGGVAGWMILVPQGEGVGVCGVFCPACYEFGPEAIAVAVKRTIAAELGGEVESVH
jgi:hypothetical protein